MKSLSVSFAQYDILWEDKNGNFEKLESLMVNYKDSLLATDLLLLPEMFQTGFSMRNNASLSETMEGPTVHWLKEKALQYDLLIGGSLIIESQGKYFNRFVFAYPDGRIAYYDKRHLFCLSKEGEYFEAGNSKTILEYKSWKILPLICYDLRFPVWSRNTEDYDLLLYTANFPAKRSYAWTQLLIARAIENQSYTLGLNRLGVDGNKLEYNGGSCLFDYEGKPLLQSEDAEGIFTTQISLEAQHTFRASFPFLADKDAFKLS